MEFVEASAPGNFLRIVPEIYELPFAPISAQRSTVKEVSMASS
jgi:hypothetical protein